MTITRHRHRPIHFLYRYRSTPDASPGRDHSEPDDPYRTPWQRDYNRIIHSGAFRRLEQKTQVFLEYHGRYCRTRLTHSLEVAQLSRSLARILGVDEDLSETIALAHDLGHPPFGHTGEEALNTAMAPFGGFNHNEQTFRVITDLEKSYASFDGLNLTWETLEGIAKHNGRFTTIDDAPASIRAYNDQKHCLHLDQWPSIEAQIAAICDDIAYNNHDIDDGLRAKCFTFADLSKVDMTRAILEKINARYPGIEKARLRHETVRQSIHMMIHDVIEQSRANLARINPANLDDIRRADIPVIAFSRQMGRHITNLRAFLKDKMYDNPKVIKESKNAMAVIRTLFDTYFHHPEYLPREWQESDASISNPRRISDYIAGMTDDFARIVREKWIVRAPSKGNAGKDNGDNAEENKNAP